MIPESYYILKIFHVVCGGIFVAAAVLSALYVLYAIKTEDSAFQEIVIKRSLAINFSVALPFALVQLLLGFSIIGVHPYSMQLVWVWGTFTAFLGLMMAWIASLYCLKQRQLKWWRFWSVIAFCLLLLMFFFMSSQV